MNDLTVYHNVKTQMQTGDLLMWSSDRLIGKAIRWRTLSEYSHASLVIRLAEYEGTEGRRFTTEALADGVVLNVLSARLAHYDGRVWWFPLDEEKCRVKRAHVGECALSFIGTPYDYQSILRLCLRRVSTQMDKLFCSEYCAVCYGLGGDAPTPADMPKLGIFKEAVRLV